MFTELFYWVCNNVILIAMPLFMLGFMAVEKWMAR